MSSTAWPAVVCCVTVLYYLMWCYCMARCNRLHYGMLVSDVLRYTVIGNIVR